jgi:hypothetical protein
LRTEWSDESAALTFFGNEHASSSISLAVAQGRIYLFTRNVGGNCRNTLYKRTTAGVWKKYRVNAGAGLAWNTPAIVFDDSNDKIYVMGVNARTRSGEYKTCGLNQESSLQNAVVEDLFIASGVAFEHLSVPAAKVNSVTGLMVCADNTTAGDVWYRHLTINAGNPVIAQASPAASEVNSTNATSVKAKEVAVNGFTESAVFPNPFNPDTFFRFRVGVAAPVRLQIFNLNGQLVQTLVDEELVAGVHQKHWNGRDKDGHVVASGTYLYRLQIGPNAKAGQLHLIK